MMTELKSLSRNVWLLLLLFLGIAGCAGRITGPELTVRAHDKQESPVVIDVRTAFEYARGHIPGALNIPVFILPFKTESIPVANKSQLVVVYCGHGPRAGLAGFILRVSGYRNVLHLQGDMEGWRRSGLPVEVVPGEL